MKELELPAYMIIQTKTMASLATLLPATKAELKEVKGLGKSKIEQFGSEILEVISVFCKENNIEQLPLELTPERKKKEKGESHRTSLTMFMEGKKAAQIAAERGIAQTTVEEHLSHFVSSGELDVNEFVSTEKIALISNYFMNSDNKHLTPAREALGEEVSYSELRFVLRYLEGMGVVE
jgi:uncharacterized protein YpbB